MRPSHLPMLRACFGTLSLQTVPGAGGCYDCLKPTSGMDKRNPGKNYKKRGDKRNRMVYTADGFAGLNLLLWSALSPGKIRR